MMHKFLKSVNKHLVNIIIQYSNIFAVRNTTYYKLYITKELNGYTYKANIQPIYQGFGKLAYFAIEIATEKPHEKGVHGRVYDKACTWYYFPTQNNLQFITYGEKYYSEIYLEAMLFEFSQYLNTY